MADYFNNSGYFNHQNLPNQVADNRNTMRGLHTKMFVVDDMGYSEHNLSTRNTISMNRAIIELQYENRELMDRVAYLESELDNLKKIVDVNLNKNLSIQHIV